MKNYKTLVFSGLISIPLILGFSSCDQGKILNPVAEESTIDSLFSARSVAVIDSLDKQCSNRKLKMIQ